MCLSSLVFFGGNTCKQTCPNIAIDICKYVWSWECECVRMSSSQAASQPAIDIHNTFIRLFLFLSFDCNNHVFMCVNECHCVSVCVFIFRLNLSAIKEGGWLGEWVFVCVAKDFTLLWAFGLFHFHKLWHFVNKFAVIHFYMFTHTHTHTGIYMCVYICISFCVISLFIYL